MDQCPAFFAYPSKPPALGETIEEAIKQINKQCAIYVKISSWVKLKNTGKIVISEICREINNSLLFMCDISELNSNVMFELGFAIAKNKRIWLTVDNSIPLNIENIKKDDLISNIGYITYLNDEDIVKSFIQEAPYIDLQSTLLKEYLYLLDNI